MSASIRLFLRRAFCLHHYHDTGGVRHVPSFCRREHATEREYSCCRCEKTIWNCMNPSNNWVIEG